MVHAVHQHLQTYSMIVVVFMCAGRPHFEGLTVSSCFFAALGPVFKLCAIGYQLVKITAHGTDELLECNFLFQVTISLKVRQVVITGFFATISPVSGPCRVRSPGGPSKDQRLGGTRRWLPGRTF